MTVQETAERHAAQYPEFRSEIMFEATLRVATANIARAIDVLSETATRDEIDAIDSGLHAASAAAHRYRDDLEQRIVTRYGTLS